MAAAGQPWSNSWCLLVDFFSSQVNRSHQTTLCHGTKQPEKLEFLEDRPWVSGEQDTSGTPAIAQNANPRTGAVVIESPLWR